MFATVLTTITTIWRPGLTIDYLKAHVPGHSMSLASVEKNSTDYFVWVYKLQTPKPISIAIKKLTAFLASKLIHEWKSYDLSDG